MSRAGQLSKIKKTNVASDINKEEIYYQLADTFSAALLPQEFHRLSLKVAKSVITTSSKDLAKSHLFLRSLEHMLMPEASLNSDVEIYLVDRSDFGADFKFPAIPFRHFNDHRISFFLEDTTGMFEFFDRERAIFYLLAPNMDEFETGLSSSSMQHLKQILNSLGYINVHGAVVGRDGEGIFLTNRGGSGKSSLMAYAIAQGAQSLGDDFLTIHPADVSTFYSLYRQFKLAKTSPAFDLAQSKYPSLGHFDGKEVFRIPVDDGGTFLPSMRVKEILIPFIGERLEIREIDPEEALKQILPSTLFLNGAIVGTIQTVKSLIQNIPTRTLELTPDLAAAYSLLEGRLAK